MVVAAKIEIPTHESASGVLGVIDYGLLPFEIKRIYWIHSAPFHSVRGLHAHKSLNQFIWATEGTAELKLSDTESSATLELNPGYGYLIAPGLWREITKFSNGAIITVACDQEFTENDYIHDWSEYQLWRKNLG